jgi:CDP-diacylglycerol---serine O-phosphatidyltransferase
VKKSVSIPTMLTLGNAVCGLAAIAFASKIGKADVTPELGRFYLTVSGWLIVAAMVFDMLDGTVARMFRVTSPLGAELDSLCDAVSFGVAPAFLLLQLGPGWEYPLLHRLVAAVAAGYLAATVLRLARYNVENVINKPATASKRFRGLPSPAAAGCVAALAIFRGTLAETWPAFDNARIHDAIEACATCGGALIAVLMISNVSYPHFTKGILRTYRKQSWLALLPLLAMVLLMRELTLVVVFWAYALTGLAQYVVARAWRRHRVPARGLDDYLPR